MAAAGACESISLSPNNHHLESLSLDAIRTSEEVRHKGVPHFPLGWTEKVLASRRRALGFRRRRGEALLFLSQNVIKLRDNGEELLRVLFCDSVLAKFPPALFGFALHSGESLVQRSGASEKRQQA